MRPNGVLRWLDRYIYLDRLRIDWRAVFPRMRWYEWAVYVVEVMATALFLEHAWNWIEARVAPIPVLGAVPPLVAGLVVAILFGSVSLLLPARAAREQASAEPWLIGALWLLAYLGEAAVTGGHPPW